MLTLTATPRSAFGKGLRKPRLAGQLPVVIYGRKQEALSFFVDGKDFARIHKEAGESTVIDFKASNASHDVLIYSVDYHPVSGEIIHADLYVVEKGKKVEVNVPLIYSGESPAVKSAGGVLVKVMHELPIEAKPADLPHDIEVDISTLTELDSQITVADLKLPAGVTAMVEADEVVVLISEAEEEPVEEEPIDLASIEVEKKGKKEEEEEATTTD